MTLDVIDAASYLAALRSELQESGRGRRFTALLSQKVLFPHRGRAKLTPGYLTLSEWDRQGQLQIAPEEVRRVTRQFDSQYGAFVGGASSKWGAPVIMDLDDGRSIYFLFDHRSFLEKTDNPHWEDILLAWLAK
ncbi:hypothetical protein [Gordonia sp. (in: high G+C Gram-positive bacteria)]|uniref:hypothetical protein n=1 Tax=Gordonia sp. (in: high G+C Gram-positive bacteria) TaxID=84139 RepID=UPI003F950542